MTIDSFLALFAGAALGMAISAHMMIVRLNRLISRLEDTCDYLCSREITRLLGSVIAEHYEKSDGR